MMTSTSSTADCAYCFDVLLAACAPRSSAAAAPPLPRPRDVENKHWQQHFPLFVTWNKLRRADDVKSGYTLRGCIGCFAPLELESGLQDYAIKSALEDSRFEPVVMSEIPQLQCAVSLLTNFTPAEHVYDWIIGTHGIRIEFMVGTRRYSATYLPEVAADQGWTHEKTLTSLVAKSGYNKTVTRELLASIKTTRYESSKSYLSYGDYVALLAQPTPALAPVAAVAVAAAAAATSAAVEVDSVAVSTVARKQIAAKA